MTGTASNPPGTAFVMTHESDPERTRSTTSLIALAVTRSLGRRGLPVVRVHPNRLDHSLASRYCREVAVSPDQYASEPALVDYLLELAPRYPEPRVLIPASDDCAQFLGMHRAELEPAFRVCVAASEVMQRVVNKQTQYEEAGRLGVPIPETYFPKSDAELEQLIARIDNYPYIIKPLVAHKWRLASMSNVSKGRKAHVVRDAQELRERYASLGDGRGDIMLQEVIGGRDERLYTFLGYFSRDSEPLAYCVRSKIRQMPVDFGYCTMTVSCHDDTVVEQSKRLLKGIGYAGICGVEYKLDAATGEYKLIEINPRPVNTIGLAPACGVDVPWLSFCDLAGSRPEPVTDWRDDVCWYRLWFDFLAVRALRGKGGPTYGAWLKSLRGTNVEAIYAADDTKPAWRYYKDLIGAEMSGQVRKRLGLGAKLSVAR